MNSQKKSDFNTKQKEKYTHDYSNDFIQALMNRSAGTEAAFFLPYLHSNMMVLDCGCGPGAITTDFAKIVAPGKVIGIDIDESQIEFARNHTGGLGIENLDFKVADIYKLPFLDDSFDAAFAHTTFQHLSDPVSALKEIYRVLKPGGFVGIRDDDVGSAIWSPINSLMEKGHTIFQEVWKHNGGDPRFGRRQRQALREAGFSNIKVSATCFCCETSEAVEEQSKFAIAMASAPNFRNQAVALNLCDEKFLDDLTEEWRKWGEHPDAFFAVIFCEAVGSDHISVSQTAETLYYD
jgi:ubiquinone/menaquinone biosynthesis C-methylase UbiE